MQTERTLAAFVVDTAFDRLPPEAVAAAKDSLLDTLGVAFAGLREPAAKIVTGLVRRQGGGRAATVIGAGFRVPSLSAALANGAIAHALDYDDTLAGGHGHPGVVLVPAVLALAEELGSSGKEIIAAYVLGAEVWYRVARVMSGLHLRGWHPTVVFGTVGAAAAASRLLRLNVEQTVTALGIAGSEASGLGQNFGTMTKPFHAGNAARSGITAAMLAHDGFTASGDMLEGEWGFPFCFYGRRVDVARMAEGMGDPFAVASPGINVKKYPSCFYAHRAMDGMLSLIEEHDMRQEDVDSVDCRVPPRMEKILFYTSPATALEGKFSMQFCLSVLLTDRRAGLAQFTDVRVNDPVVRELMKRVTLGVHADWLEGESREARPDVVTVRLKDGQVYRREVDKARGSPGLPLSHDELLAKYRDCAALFLPEERVERSIELVERLDRLDTVNELMDIAVGR